ncbi:hypothetical protein CTAYLR_007991 [Chrysophaeum taylorii]|uniref:protein-tyrosine-phosphatase n=1 Tax=Chrysophaeum taylorii TaxID=2483200 RepID=A0AAD7XHD5_9STRA|nr:hypothetical protein CTAYLR_007991 [Chrysophaeum taylorii]
MGLGKRASFAEGTANPTSPSPMSSLYVQTSSPRTPRTPRDKDWDEEARLLFRRLNMEGIRSREKYRNMDCVYQHPGTGAKLFIGNQTAARSESVLASEAIFHVVNCQDASTANFFERDPRFSYKRFPVSHWWRAPKVETHAGILAFFEHGCHAWIDSKLAAGHNVMVHCLAGAHRAGTTGVSFMMRKGHFDVVTAIRLAKWQRPIVDPVGQLLELLERLQAAYEATGIRLVTTAPPRALVRANLLADD